MKVKLDFVTNSSSCCYLIASDVRLFKKDLLKMGIRDSSINHFKCIGDKEKLISFTEGLGQKCDWVKKATGPKQFWGMRKEWYEKAKDIIEDGGYIVTIDIERNYDDVEQFEALAFEILDKEYD